MLLRFSVCAGHAQGEIGASPVWRTVDVPLPVDEVAIGRQPGATIELPFAAVSARHARIFGQAGAYRIEDLGSSNGTLLGGRRLLPHVPLPISPGDTFDFAGAKVRFDGELAAASSTTSPEGTDTLARRLVHDVFAACPPAETVRLVGLTGPGAGCELPLVSLERPALVGRGDTCDLVLCDENVSREHASFQRSPAGVVVRDLGSKNGIELQGKPIAGECHVRDGDNIRIGDTTLRLVDPEDRFLRQVQQVEPAQEGSLPPVPSEAAPQRGTRRVALAIPDTEGRKSSSSEPASTGGSGVRPSRLPLVASLVAILVLLCVAGLVLALAFGS